jgi:hypothetical protein
MRRRLSTAGWLVALLALAAFPAPAALAAPFCLELQSVPPQCIYFDANDCRVEANHQHGACVANPQEVGLVPSVGAYCIVTSGGASSCTYQDAVSCSREAVHQGGVCVTAPVAAAGTTPNPLQSRPGEAGQETPTP